MIEADELWGFVGFKVNVRWVWAALDAETRRVVTMVVGDRSAFTAWCLWEFLPARRVPNRRRVLYRPLASYRAALPADRHAAAGKEEGPTCHVERFWDTLRQR